MGSMIALQFNVAAPVGPQRRSGSKGVFATRKCWLSVDTVNCKPAFTSGSMSAIRAARQTGSSECRSVSRCISRKMDVPCSSRMRSPCSPSWKKKRYSSTGVVRGSRPLLFAVHCKTSADATPGNLPSPLPPRPLGENKPGQRVATYAGECVNAGVAVAFRAGKVVLLTQ